MSFPRKRESSAALDAIDLTPAAGNGILDRRVFLKRGLTFATALAAGAASAADKADGKLQSVPPWMRRPGKPFSPYGQPSPHEKEVARRIGANKAVPGNGISWSPLEDLEGMLTPSGLHFERHHNGVPEIDPEQHQLLIHGMVKQPLTFNVRDLSRYPMRSQLIFLECGGNSNAGWHEQPIQKPVGSVHGLVSCSEWTGVTMRILLEEAGVDSKASWIVAEGADAFAMNVSIPLSKVMDDCTSRSIRTAKSCARSTAIRCASLFPDGKVL